MKSGWATEAAQDIAAISSRRTKMTSKYLTLHDCHFPQFISQRKTWSTISDNLMPPTLQNNPRLNLSLPAFNLGIKRSFFSALGQRNSYSNAITRRQLGTNSLQLQNFDNFPLRFALDVVAIPCPKLRGHCSPSIPKLIGAIMSISESYLTPQPF